MKKNKIFIACDSANISKIKEVTGWQPKYTQGLYLDFINEKI